VALEHDARRARYLLACGLAPALFVAVLLVEGAIRPGYDPLHHFGSELSLGPSGWVQTTNFLITGLLVVGFASGLRRALGSGRGSVAAPILTGVFGVTLIVAGIFPTDPKPGYPPGTAGTIEAITVPGRIHDLNALPCFAALTATALVLAGRFAGEPGRRGRMLGCLAIGLVVPATFVSAGPCSARPPRPAPGRLLPRARPAAHCHARLRLAQRDRPPPAARATQLADPTARARSHHSPVTYVTIAGNAQRG
jgi:Protein of unknown function (DUF998)